MNREQVAKVFEARRKIVAERILKNLAHSRAHAHLSAFDRMKMADQQAFEIMNTPPDEMDEEKMATFPGMTPDGFFVDSEE